jgi:predicted TIM-barrel fold metal-dependent hydrolase
MPIIDIHPHVISSDTKRYPRAPIGGHQSDWSRERPVSVEAMILAMDEAGVAKSALVQASTCYGHDNSYLADCVAAHPERFTGVFSADIAAPDATEKLAYWMSKGLAGLRLFTTGSTMPGQQEFPHDRNSFRGWQFAQDHNLPVSLQMTVKAIPDLLEVLSRFPKLIVILDHCARPSLEDGPPYEAAAPLWSLATHTNVYLKLTPRVFLGSRSGKATPESFFGRLVASFGAARLAWGSNFPATEGSLPELLQLAQDCLGFLPASDREWIFSRTAQRLYPALKG